MKYLVLFYMVSIATYNFWGDNAFIYWRFHYFFTIHLTLMFLFYNLYRQAVKKTSKRMFLSGTIFSVFYALFQLLTLTSKSIAEYLGKVNNWLWSMVSVLIVLILLFCNYDTNHAGKTD